MKKIISNFTLSIIILFLALIILIPYFTSHFLAQRQKKEIAENQQKLLKEELVKMDIEERARREKERKIYLMGKFDPDLREDFILVSPEYNLSGNKIYLRKETWTAFLEMAQVAHNDKIELKIASATRNFNYQKDLWENKWTGVKTVRGKDLSKSILNELERFKKILEYSAAPGTSRHHFGTDIDINNAEPEYFNSPKGSKEYDWLVNNAYKFGFCQTYNKKGESRKIGYNEEKWHWSYLPLSQTLTQEYKNLIKNEDIKGFLGDKYVQDFDLINDYVLSINPECL